MELAVTFMLVMARLMAVMMTAPLLGSRVVGRMPRVGIAFAITIIALPLVDPSIVPLEPGSIVSALLSEILIGALLGLGVSILFAAAHMVGSVIGQMAGLQVADQLDPNTGQATSSVSQLFGIVSLAVFALIGGPEMIISAVLDTFVNLPLGYSLKTDSVLALVTELLQQSFVLTLRGVGPAVASLMVATVVIGLIGRAYPQMNMLHLGLNGNLAVMLLAIFLTLGGCIWLFVDDWKQAVDVIQAAITPANHTIF